MWLITKLLQHWERFIITDEKLSEPALVSLIRTLSQNYSIQCHLKMTPSLVSSWLYNLMKMISRVSRSSPSFRCGCMSFSSWQVVAGLSLVPCGKLKDSSASSLSGIDHLLDAGLGRYRGIHHSVSHPINLSIYKSINQ